MALTPPRLSDILILRAYLPRAALLWVGARLMAAVFVRRPRCLLADEPYRGIAPKDAEDLTRAFRALAAEGVVVVVSGHEVGTLLAAADHVTWCTSGTTYELGAPAAAVRHEVFAREYLGPAGARGAVSGG